MKSRSVNKKLQAILNAAVVIIITPLFLSLFVDSPYVFTVKQIFGFDSAYEAESDCITFLNVGQGDAILIRSNGNFALIDTGDGESTDIVRSLKQNGVDKIDVLLLTHWHDDHIGGAETVLREFTVQNLVMPRIPDNRSDTYNSAFEVNKAAENAGVRFTTAAQGLVLNVGDFELTVLYYCPGNTSENDRSVVIMAECRDFRFLLMSDAEETLENQLIESGIRLDCNVLKVGHHGSDTSTSNKFLNAASPDYAVVSVGLKNEYGHPSSKILRRLAYSKTEIYRTDTGGEIDVYVLEDSLEFSAKLLD